MSRFHQQILRSRWLPHRPHPKQALFLLHDAWLEVLYGGAAGGAKSDALLMAALQYVDIPGYSAILFRRTYPDLSLRGFLMDRAREWLDGRGAAWDGRNKRWNFPSGATLTFGYLEHAGDERRYKSAEFQFIGLDELTEFTGGETQYTFLFSRLRKPSSGPLADVPLRMRAASNPGGPGHSWVKARFIPDEFLKSDDADRFSKVYNTNGRVFVPARLEDNPSLNREEYERGLPQLEPVTRAQMRKGDWTAHASGRFQPGWFRRYRIQGDTYLLDNGECILRQRVLRAALLDPANRKTKASKYTAIGVFAFSDGDRLFVLDVVRERLSIQEIIPRFDSLCGRWGPLDWAGIEANGFQIALVQEATDRKYRHIPTVRELDPEGKSKLTRATAAIIRAQQGQVYVPERGPGTEWVDDYIAELGQFTGDEKQDVYTDQVDITAYAVLGDDRYSLPVGAEGAFVFGRSSGSQRRNAY